MEGSNYDEEGEEVEEVILICDHNNGLWDQGHLTQSQCLF